MSDTKQLLLLHLAHAKHALERAKNNSYSDQRKENYQNQLLLLFDEIEKDVELNLPTLTDAQIYDSHKKHLDFIIKSLQFLDSSTLNQIPYEIVECLRLAMNEWEPTDEFIIVTSLINNAQGFSYEWWLAIDDNLYKSIETKYPPIKFEHRLVQINLPKALSRDYLVAVVLYHELGHFIDMRNSLMISLIYETLDKIYLNSFSQAELDELKIYFPDLAWYINNVNRPDWNLIAHYFTSTLFHFREYFCDLFAAQYVGKSSSLYVTYLGQNNNEHSPTHPSDVNRAKVVTDFLGGQNNLVVTLINNSVQRIKPTTLQKRYTDVPKTDFFQLVPTLLANNQIHGIFNTGWDLWLTDQAALGAQVNSTEPSRVYTVINNLIEKSIGNFISLNEWRKIYPTAEPLPDTKPKSLLAQFFQTTKKGILTKAEILQLLHQNKLFIRPLLSNSQIGEAGIDFRLGYDFLVSVQGRDAFINASKNEWIPGGHQRNIKQFFQSSRRQLGETFILHPNQTVLAVTLEYVRLPEDCMLMLFMRSSYARLGLTISTIVQPGYCGCLNLEFTNSNNNPINLAIGARIVQALICRVSSSTQYFHTPRKYVCQVRPEPSAVINDDDLTALNQLWKQNNKR